MKEIKITTGFKKIVKIKWMLIKSLLDKSSISKKNNEMKNQTVKIWENYAMATQKEKCSPCFDAKKQIQLYHTKKNI